MIDYIEGNIFDSPAQVIVNTVNTVGVMGKGIALAFKQRYPEMFQRYKTTCEKHLLTIGKLMLFYEADHWLLLFPTKENWRNPSKLEYIEKGLMKFVSTYAEKGINSIAFPRLGCGNGELNWNDVKPLMEKYLKPLPIDVYIYLRADSSTIPEHKEPQKTLKWLKENAKDMSFNGVKDDLINMSAIIPYKFSAFEQHYEMRYKEILSITCEESKQIYNTKEDDLFAIWDNIRSRCVFSSEESSFSEQIIFELLFSAGYLSRVKILNSKQDRMVNGFQVNSALERILAFKED